MSKFVLPEELKSVIETQVGIKLDGEITTDECRKVFEFLYSIAKQFHPDIDDDIDARIDKVEAFAVKQKKITKAAILAFCNGIRIVSKIKDDDDNVTQK